MDFASAPAIFVSSFVIALSGALMPGPLLAVTVRHASRRGVSAAPLLILGHGALEAVLVVLLLVGLADWIRGEGATTAIALAGSAMLLWMAWGMAREVRTLRLPGPGGRGEEADPGEDGRGGRFRTVVDGIVASASNPYWTVWWATIGLGYLVLSRDLGARGVLLFFAGHLLADAAWYLFVGVAVSMGRTRFTDRMYRAVVGGCAAFLVLFAVSFGSFGVSRLFRLL